MAHSYSFPSLEQDDDGHSAPNVIKIGPWTAAEDALLLAYVRKHGAGNWCKISGLPRSGKSCRLRWLNHLQDHDFKKGPLSAEEQSMIIHQHAALGDRRWDRIAAMLPGRTANEVRNFWNTRKKRLISREATDIIPGAHNSEDPNEEQQEPTEMLKQPVSWTISAEGHAEGVPIHIPRTHKRSRL